MSNSVLELNKAKLEDLLPDIEQRFFTDASYAVIDENWLVEEGFIAYRKWMDFAGLRDWKGNWDCDNLAASYKLFLQILHAKHNPYTFTQRFNKKGKNTTNVDSVAIGTIFYKISRKGSSSYHAINLAICSAGYNFDRRGNTHKFKKVYIEPEHGAIIKLTKKEEDSICYINF